MKNQKPVILVVDDESNNVELIDSILSIKNYEILKAYNGKEALKIIELKSADIDLVLLDVMMPDLDGFEVCSLITKSEIYSDIPVILLTALLDDESQLKAFKLGAVDFISKPIKREILAARVNTHIDLKLKKDRLNALITEKEILNQKLSLSLKKIFYLWSLIVIFLFAMAVLIFI